MKRSLMLFSCIGYFLVLGQAGNASLPGLNIVHELQLEQVKRAYIEGRNEYAICMATCFIDDEVLERHQRFYFLMARNLMTGKDEEMIQSWIAEDDKCAWLYEHVYMH